MILYIENPKHSIRKLLELISEFSKVAGYKINTQESLAFLYTNNEKSERAINESIAFIATKRIKYLWINLPKETKERYTENYKTLREEIKDDINRWRDIPCSWIRRINTVKWLYYQMQSTDSMWSLLNYQWHFFTELEQKVSQFIWNTKHPKEPSHLEKEEWSWRNQASWLQVILQSHSHQQYGTGTETEI